MHLHVKQHELDNKGIDRNTIDSGTKLRIIWTNWRKVLRSDLAARAKSNPKAIWNYIKTKSKTRVGIGDLRTDPNDKKSRKTDDDSEKAEILASFFSSVFTREPDGELPDFMDREPKESMEDLYISKEDIEKNAQKGQGRQVTWYGQNSPEATERNRIDY